MRADLLLRSSFLCLLSAAAVLPASLAGAADYDPPLVVDQPAVDQAPEYVPVEVSSGWYLRGDIGGAVNAFEHAEGDDLEEDKFPLVAGIGMGYHWTDYLRTELNLGILPASEFTSEYISSCLGETTVTITDRLTNRSAYDTFQDSRPCRGGDEGSNKSYSLFADAYLDLGTYAGLTPYVGGGVGAVYTKMRAARGDRDCRDDSSTVINGNLTQITNFACYDDEYYEGDVNSEGQYNFAYKLGAGLSYRVSNNGSLDLGYEYVSVLDAKTVGYENNNFVYDEGFDVHAVKVGFRYDMW